METPTVSTFNDLPVAMQWLVKELSAVKKAIETLPGTMPAKLSRIDDEYITRKEAAARLRISLNTLDSYSHDGKIKAYRLGSRVLFKAHEISPALKVMSASSL